MHLDIRGKNFSLCLHSLSINLDLAYIYLSPKRARKSITRYWSSKHCSFLFKSPHWKMQKKSIAYSNDSYKLACKRTKRENVKKLKKRVRRLLYICAPFLYRNMKKFLKRVCHLLYICASFLSRTRTMIKQVYEWSKIE